jgi:hypothetical protein
MSAYVTAASAANSEPAARLARLISTLRSPKVGHAMTIEQVDCQAIADDIALLLARPLEPDHSLRPIADALRDGTPIIGLSFGRYGHVGLAWWQAEFDAWIEGCREMTLAEGLTFEDGTARRLHSPEIVTPTHWLPYSVPRPADAS